MACAKRQQLGNDDTNAWAAYKHWKDVGGEEKELTRLWNVASDVKTELRLHIDACPECKPK